MLVPSVGRAQRADGLPAQIEILPISPGPLPSPTVRPLRFPRGTPPALREITERLSVIGLPDPRGSEYRAIAIYVGRDAWDGLDGIVRTRGWVLPGRRFAIAHNGMIYALAAVGERIDISRAAPCARAMIAYPHVERGSVDCVPDWLTSVQLVRLGDLRGALAVAPADMLQDPDATVRSVALHVAWYARARAIGAHIRGDDAAALHALRIAARARDLARQLGAPEEDQWTGLRDLGIVDELLADHERRAREPTRDLGPIEGRSLTALIASMDQVAAVQGGQPGGFVFAWDPIVSAILRAGPAAVSPLIDVVEHHDGLTRSIWAWRDFVPSRGLVHVRTVAVDMLMELLGVDDLWSFEHPAPTNVDGAALAVRLRELAAEYPSASARSIGVLFDRQGSLADWSDAADRLFRPLEGGFQTAGWAPGDVSWDGLMGGTLRGRVDEIGDALAARLADGMSRDTALQMRGCMIARTIVQWGPTRARLRPFFDHCLSSNARCVCLPAVAHALHSIGDPNALRDYSAYMRRVAPSGMGDLLEPVLRNPDHPAMRAVATWYVESSPWTSELEPLLDPRALSVEPFVRAILAALADPARRDRVAERLAPMFDLTFERDWAPERRADAIRGLERAINAARAERARPPSRREP
jgi:hypothetical protein